jgi:predicted DNA-binding transcriptional regulator AlpA
MEKMLDYFEVAERIGISHWTLRRWVKRKAFPEPAVKQFQTHRFSQGQLDRWLESSGRKTRLSAR